MLKPISKVVPENIGGDVSSIVAYTISALDNYTPEHLGKNTERHLADLKQVFLEVIQILESLEMNCQLWFTTIFSTSFQSPTGQQIPGHQLLQQLSRYHSKASLGQENSAMDAFCSCIKDLVDVDIKRPSHLVESGIYKLPRKVEEVITPYEKPLSIIQELMDNIFKYHFAGNPFELLENKNILLNTTYRFATGLQLKGETIIQALCVAQFRADYPDSKDTIKQILENSSYKTEKILNQYLRATTNQLLKGERFSVTNISESLQNIEKLDLFELQTLATSAVTSVVTSNPRLLKEETLGLVCFQDPQGNRCTLFKLFSHIALKKWQLENPDNTGTPITEILTKRGYRLVDVLRELIFSKTESREKNLRDMPNDDFKIYVENTQLSPVLDILIQMGNSPEMIIDTLRLVDSGAASNATLEELVPRYVGLKVDIDRKGGGGSGGRNVGEGESSFIAALFHLAALGKNLEFTEEQFQVAKDLTIRSYRKSFEKKGEELLQSILEYKERIIDGGAEQFVENGSKNTIIRLLDETRQYFNDILNEPYGEMVTRPFNYQIEGIRFLSNRDHALLADDVGVAKTYQAIAAALRNNYRTLYVTTAATISNVKKEIETHTHLRQAAGDIVIINNRSPKERRQQIEGLSGGQFILISYEMLARLNDDKKQQDLYKKIQENIDLCILDECHTPENEDTMRGEAIRQLDIKKRWFLTATPYRNGIAGMFWILNCIDPVKFPNKELFLSQHCKDLGGLFELNTRLRDIMLRRTKEDTVDVFEDPTVLSFEEQLLDGKPRVPQQRIIKPSEEGYFTLMPEQEQTLYWMITNLFEWASNYNDRIAPIGEEIELTTLNPLQKFQLIHRAIYNPASLGMPEPETLYQALDEIVDNNIIQQAKLILWVQRYSVADTLARRYKNYGTMVLDGRTPAEKRLGFIDKYQESSRVKILIANEIALGTGVTITSAQKAIMVQPSWTPTRLIQTLGRHQRVLTLDKLRFAKQFADTCFLIPRYSQELLDSISDADYRELFNKGTLPEQTFERIQGGRTIFKVVTEGYIDEKEYYRGFQRSLAGAMGLIEGKRNDLTAGMKASTKAMMRIVMLLEPLWSKGILNQDLEQALFHLISHGRHAAHSKQIETIATKIAEAENIQPAAIRFIGSIFEIKNKIARQQLLTLVPLILDRGDELSSELSALDNIDIESGATNILKILSILYRHQGTPFSNNLEQLIDAASNLGKGPAARETKRTLLFGLMHTLSSGTTSSHSALSLLQRGLELSDDDTMLNSKVKTVYQIGHLTKFKHPAVAELFMKDFETFEDFSKDLEQTVRTVLEDTFSINHGTIDSMLADHPTWNNSVDHILGMIVGWGNIEDIKDRKQALRQAAEVFGCIFNNEFAELRHNTNLTDGKVIEYKQQEPKFWVVYQQNIKKEYKVSTNTEKAEKALLQGFQSLKVEVYSTAQQLEGRATIALFDGSLRHAGINPAEGFKSLKNHRAIINSQLNRVRNGDVLEKREEVSAVFKQYKIKNNVGLGDLLLVRNDLDRALDWLQLESEFRNFSTTGSFESNVNVKNILQRKKQFYEAECAYHLAYTTERLLDLFNVNTASEGIKVIIEECDDPAIISRMGCLSPGMINCHNPNADAYFTRWVLGALASKNFKLLVVRDASNPVKILAVAPTKVRKKVGDLQDSATLFLERGLSELPYDFKPEMLDLLQDKATRMSSELGQPVGVSFQINGRARKSDIIIAGTGAYTKDEYCEAVFKLRNSDTLMHAARPYDPTKSSNDLDDSVIKGFGVDGHSIDEVVRTLKKSAAALVIDIRQKSRQKSYINCLPDELETRLSRSKIGFQYWGDSIGNPLGGNGPTAQAAYEDFIKTNEFKKSLDDLVEVINSTAGTIIILGAKKKEKNCTRSLLLHQIYQRIGEGVGVT